MEAASLGADRELIMAGATPTEARPSTISMNSMQFVDITAAWSPGRSPSPWCAAADTRSMRSTSCAYVRRASPCSTASLSGVRLADVRTPSAIVIGR